MRSLLFHRGICAGILFAISVVAGAEGMIMADDTAGETDAVMTSSEFDMKTEEAVPQVPVEPEVTASLSQAGDWSDGKDHYYQYDVTVTNCSDTQIRDWTISVDTAGDTIVSQFWNCTWSMEEGVLTLIPAEYARVLDPGTSSQGIGLIVTSEDPSPWDTYRITCTTGSGTEILITGNSVSDREASAISQDSEEYSKKTPDTGMETKTADKETKTADKETKTADKETKTADKETKGLEAATMVWNAEDGVKVPWLHVDGTQLTDADGNAVRLQGISTHGLGVFPEFVSEESFRSLRDDFGANVMRLALYTQKDNGYCDCDEAGRLAQEELIDRGVQACEALGMYVIIDWHILSDGSPLIHEDEAADFFSRMSEKYGDKPNVIFEICNEPNGSSWEQEIVPYASRIIPVIRENAPKSLILVGTNTWSQDVNEPAASPLEYDNLMYCLHFYAGTHKDDLRNKLVSAMDQGAPIFISECSICDASGNGAVDYESAEAWKRLIAERGLSYIEWNLSNKNESSAMILPSCTKLSGWTVDELSETALWYRDMMRGFAGLE